MSVEMVLKLEHREPADYFDLQNAWKNKRDGTFAEFDGRTIGGLTLHRKFFLPRDESFPIDKLFNTIDAELNARRFVIVSFWWRASYQMGVIVDHNPPVNTAAGAFNPTRCFIHSYSGAGLTFTGAALSLKTRQPIG